MFGASIYARAISEGNRPDKVGNNWQYHPRSDAHSKAACWGVTFDLLLDCPLLRNHVSAGKVGFGINHRMHDFRVNRKKDLDLVICTPAAGSDEGILFRELADSYTLSLTEEERAALDGLPDFRSRSVGSTLVALEAKACMTEHSKARPRLYDELSSSFQTILGDTRSAIAAGFVSINVADRFVSPLRNAYKSRLAKKEITFHDQPRAALGMLDKVSELPRRANEDDYGFDALGVTLVSCRNDGSPVELVDRLSDGSVVPEILRYEALVKRTSAIYTSRFRAL